MRLSIQNRLVAAFLVASLVPLACLFLLLHLVSEREITERLDRAAELAERSLSGFQERASWIAEGLSEDGKAIAAIQAGNEEPFRKLLDEGWVIAVSPRGEGGVAETIETLLVFEKEGNKLYGMVWNGME